MTRPENPAKAIAPPSPDLAAVLRAACARAGLSDAGAQVIHHYANAVCLLPAEPAVARISQDGLVHRARTALHVTKWLTETHGYPATAPLQDEPIVVDGNAVVTFWKYYPQPQAAASPDSADLGRLVRRLHDLPEPPVQLPSWKPLQSLHDLTTGPVGQASLSAPDRKWLLAKVDQIQGELAAMDWPLGQGLIHADAWAGNLMWDTATTATPVRLGDWDTVCRGPLEIDLIPSWHAATRYDRGAQWARAFADAYGHDLESWDGFDVLFIMRDLVQLAGPMRRAPQETAFAAALRQRLDGIKANDRGAWREF